MFLKELNYWSNLKTKTSFKFFFFLFVFKTGLKIHNENIVYKFKFKKPNSYRTDLNLNHTKSEDGAFASKDEDESGNELSQGGSNGVRVGSLIGPSNSISSRRHDGGDHQ